MQTNNKPYLFQVHGLNNRYNNTCDYVIKTLAPQTSNQTVYEVIRGTDNSVYLYIEVAGIDWNTVSNYINTNRFLKRINNGAKDEINYASIVKTGCQVYRGTKQMQNMPMNINKMMMQHNIQQQNIHQPNNIQMNMNQNNMINNHAMSNNFINQQKKAAEDLKKQNQVNMLKGLDAKNCDTQHISEFFNKETILKKIQKYQTIHPANKDAIKSYLNWFSQYVDDMYFIVNNCALGKADKEKCWYKVATVSNNNKIKFSDSTAKACLNLLYKTNFLNNRNNAIDGHNLIKDMNETMQYLVQCSIDICDGKINQANIDKIIAVYEQLRECLSTNPKAFVDRGILGFGTDRDNAFRGIVNDNVKIKNLKDLVVGVIRFFAG